MSSATSTDTTAGGSVLSLPQGGGAISGLGEKFSPDLFTGTGNVSVPIQVPAGRLKLQPQLSLGYSTGNGNGPFGLGWQLSVPGVSRKTSHGLPRYRDLPDVADPEGNPADVFILSGAEDLVPVGSPAPGRARYRPRTEGLFARIEHVTGDAGDVWEVRTRDGLVTLYGTPRPADADASWRDPAVAADPADPSRIFAWRITQTRDLLGNLVRYEYTADEGEDYPHRWRHPLLTSISYADYGDRAAPSFLVTVDFEYEPRPDPFSDYRAGFEVRTTTRCPAIRVRTHAADGVARVAREYRFSYTQAPFNEVSQLTRVDVVGVDEQASPGPREQALAPITFDYSRFDPAGRRFERITGAGVPVTSLADPTLTLVDLHGFGLPDVLELGPQVRRYWRNTGGGRLDLPRTLDQAPPLSLADPGVQVLDADGDGRPDLMVTGVGARAGVNGGTGLSGYFPMSFPAGWSQRSFQRYRQVPAVAPRDPAVRLVDLTGDGLTDVLRSGSRLTAWFNDRDPDRAWAGTATRNGSVPQVDFSDSRVRLADMTGDGLQDLVILRSGNITYWPNLGHGQWGQPVVMRQAPRFGDGFDPRRVLLGDVDGDGLADLIYIDNGRVQVWGNQGGNAFTADPMTVFGTPSVADTDAVQLADLHGTGMAGLLYTRPAGGTSGSGWRFLDLTGGVKPYLLTGMDNHLGATTTVTYRPSTAEYLRDQATTATRWRTTLPFPVHVVSHVEVLDEISGGRLTTQYRYHHGYWDGVEREFRGFAMVEQFDTETFDRSPSSGPGVAPVPAVHFSPPTLTKSWFHPGPVAAVEAGDWTELDLRHEYWDGDPGMLSRPVELTGFLGGLTRTARRAALRTLRGQLLRSELYALDGTAREDRPYTVTETVSGVREESPPPVGGQPGSDRERIFFPFPLGQRTTQWERGDEPMTQFAFPAGYDEYGMATSQVAVAVPRGRDPLIADPAATQQYLATYATTEYAHRDDADHYLVGRVVRTTGYEIVNNGQPSVTDVRDAVLDGPASGGNGVSLRVIGHTRTFYDGDAFVGLPLGVLGEHGLAVRAESLAFTDGFLDDLYAPGDPLAVSPRPAYLSPGVATTWSQEYPPEFRDLLPELAGYVHYADGEVPGSPGGFYVLTARHRYDVHEPNRVPRGLPLASLDPLGALSQVDYDQHDLLPVRTIDPAGLAIAAVHDYRMLQPQVMTDPNGNSTSVTFSPAGLVTAHYTRGKTGEGDQAAPSTQMSYDLLAFTERGQPASVRSTRRVHHDTDTDTDVPAGQRNDVIVSVEYSDGFGRVLQTRAQAEDTLFGDPTFGGAVIPADQFAPVGDTMGRTRGPSDPDNVIVSGWQIYDNKGHMVQKYEPFYAVGFDYIEPVDAQLGQKATLFYDPRGQVIRTVNPDGSEQRVLFGVPADLADPDVVTPTPWESYTYDANDNAGRTHAALAEAYHDHWNTPASIEVDALGRTVRAVARNGTPEQAGTTWFTTRSGYDIQSNLVSITDALEREAFRYRIDLAKRRWRMDSIDAGRRDTVPDALSNPIESRDSKGALTLGVFDRLHRATKVWARDQATGTVTLRQRIEYGDGGDPDQPAAERDAARAHNLLGRPVRLHDEAGLITTVVVDFKGNLLESVRRVIADAPVLATYQQAQGNDWQVVPFQVDWQPTPGQTQNDRDAELLEPNGYQTTTGYDALNRITRHILPTDVEGRRRELHPTYNRAGGLEQVRLDDTVYVQRIAYDAKGQRALIAYGNGVMTRYTYHPNTFRLARLRSEGYTLVDGTTYRPGGEVLQDYGYDNDLVGNILTIRDRTPGSGIQNNPEGFGVDIPPRLRQLLISGDAIDRQFTYDPTYRLHSATGREHLAPPNADPWIDLPRGTDITQVQRYEETYRYDAAGSMRQLAHAAAGGFTRDFTLQASNNHLRRMTIGTTPYVNTFDANGNLVAETTTRHFQWNHADQLTAFATQTDGAEPSVHAQYLYDASGQRVKKLVRRQGGAVEVTHYLDEVFEHHRWSGATPGQCNQLHVMDDNHRIALVRAGVAHPDDRGPAIAVHLADHLGSTTTVLDDTGALVNREEFTPYGETTFGSFTRKRYRFTGKERDEESGLSYHVARYYAPWTARWASCDPLHCSESLPIGLERSGKRSSGKVNPASCHTNAYTYCLNNPNRFVDEDGRNPLHFVHYAHQALDLAEAGEAVESDEPIAGAFYFAAIFADLPLAFILSAIGSMAEGVGERRREAQKAAEERHKEVVRQVQAHIRETLGQHAAAVHAKSVIYSPAQARKISELRARIIDRPAALHQPGAERRDSLPVNTLGNRAIDKSERLLELLDVELRSGQTPLGPESPKSQLESAVVEIKGLELTLSPASGISVTGIDPSTRQYRLEYTPKEAVGSEYMVLPKRQ